MNLDSTCQIYLYFYSKVIEIQRFTINCFMKNFKVNYVQDKISLQTILSFYSLRLKINSMKIRKLKKLFSFFLLCFIIETGEDKNERICWFAN